MRVLLGRMVDAGRGEGKARHMAVPWGGKTAIPSPLVRAATARHR
jgi:hypothetical protein